MLLEFLGIQDDRDLARVFAAAGRLERSISRFELATADPISGSLVAHTVSEASIAASVRLAGFQVSTEVVTRVLASDTEDLDPPAVAAVRGVSDALHAVLDKPGDLPLSESQLKYLQSLLLRHDPSAASLRRQYRREGEDVAAIPASLSVLIEWTKSQLDASANAADRLPASLVVGTFAHRLQLIRPFAVGNGRLARAIGAQLLAQCGYDFLATDSLEVELEVRSTTLAHALRTGDSIGWLAGFLDALAACADTAASRQFGQNPERTRRAGLSIRRTQDPIAVSQILTPRQDRVLAAMHVRTAAKIGDLLPVLAIPRATLKKDLRTLVDAGRLTTTGIRKGTVYRVLPDSQPAD